MKPQDFADVLAFEQARYEGRRTPRRPSNFQVAYARECDEARQTFDDFVADREYVERDAYYFRRIFRPIDLGKFAVGVTRPHLFAQLSLQERRSDRNPEKVTERQRIIEIFPEGIEMQSTNGDWSYAQPSGANNYALGGFIAGKASLADRRRRAIPSSVAALNEFRDTLGHVMEAAISLEAQNPES